MKKIKRNGNIFLYDDNHNLHCDGAPAIIGFQREEWWRKGKLHRTDGPAYRFLDCMSWYINGKCHRVNGPAMIWSKGVNAWYINGVEITEEQFNDKKALALLLITY